MSVPWWRRPPERAAPHVSAYDRGPATGQSKPEPALVGAAVGATNAAAEPERAGGAVAACAGVAAADPRLAFAAFLLVASALLSFEFLANGLVGKALLFDCAELYHFFFGSHLERCERLDRCFGRILLEGQLLASFLDVAHYGVEFVEICNDGVCRHGRKDVGGEYVICLVEVDEQWETRSASADELADRLRFKSIAHLVSAGFDGSQLLLGLGNVEDELVDLGLLVEHRLCSGVRSISGILDFTCGPFGGRLA